MPSHLNLDEVQEWDSSQARRPNTVVKETVFILFKYLECNNSKIKDYFMILQKVILISISNRLPATFYVAGQNIDQNRNCLAAPDPDPEGFKDPF